MRFQPSGISVFYPFRDRLFLITAGHNLNGISSADQLQVVLPKRTTRVSVLGFNASLDGQDYPDVAWIEVDPGVLGYSDFSATTLENFRLDASHDPARAIQCQGFPDSEILKLEGGSESFCSVAIGTYSQPPVDGEGTIADTYLIEYPPHDLLFGERAPEAGGISGGGVWMLEPPPRSGVGWNTSRVHMVAIPRSKSEKRSNCIRCTPVRRWFEFFDSEFEEFRDELEACLWTRG